MLSCRSNIIIGFIGMLVFSSCIESKYGLDIDPTLDKHAASFLNELPGIGGNIYNDMNVSVKAKKVEIYKASFKEVTIEKDNLLEFTELNDKSTHSKVKYRDIDGFMQDLYLMKYNFKCDAGGEDVEVTAVTFLSLHYRPMESDPFIYCTGPGPVYWGVVNEGYISFDSVLTINSVKKHSTDYYLHIKKRKKNKEFNLLFMPADFPSKPKKDDGFEIKKIVRMDPNRMGGSKPLVFDIPVIFKDSMAMHFDYIKTVSLNQ